MARLSLSTRYPTPHHYPLVMERDSLSACHCASLDPSAAPATTYRRPASISVQSVTLQSRREPVSGREARRSRLAASRQPHKLDRDTATASPVILGEYGRGLSVPITRGIGCLSRPNRAVSGTEYPSSVPIGVGIVVGIKVSSRRHRVTLAVCLLIEFDRPWPHQNQQRCS